MKSGDEIFSRRSELIHEIANLFEERWRTIENKAKPSSVAEEEKNSSIYYLFYSVNEKLGNTCEAIHRMTSGPPHVMSIEINCWICLLL